MLGRLFRFYVCMMKQLIRFYRLLNILSIDVALGAVCCAAWFAVLFNVHLKPYALIALGLTVWIIYTVDHLLDARKIKGPASTERHRFHQQNFKFLLVVLLLAVLTDLLFVFLVRKAIFQWGLVLATAMVIYFFVQQRLKYLKEFIVALLFSCGVLLPSWSLAQHQPGGSLALVIIQFMLTALLNLLLFSWFDRHHDSRDRRESFVTFIGEGRTKTILWVIFATNYVLMAVSILYAPSVFDKVIVIFSMNTILAFVFIQAHWFEMNDRFRLVGDSIFLLPVVYLFL